MLDKNEVQELYENDMQAHFPPAELKRLDRIKNLIDAGHYEVDGLFANEALRAYACSIGFINEMRLLDYFAVRRRFRGQNVGSQFLQSLTKRDDFPGFIIEVERVSSGKTPEERRTRKRRIAFYLKNGAYLTHVQSTLFGTDFDILVLPRAKSGKATADTVKATYEKIYAEMFPEGLTEDQLSVYMKDA